jgi:hypothetical protein
VIITGYVTAGDTNIHPCPGVASGQDGRKGREIKKEPVNVATSPALFMFFD